MESDARPPLTDVRVVDLTQSIAGMTATMLLADLGADVVRFDEREDQLPGDVMWHRNKRIVRPSIEAQRTAISSCDVVVTSADDPTQLLGPAVGTDVVHLDLPTILAEAGEPPDVYNAAVHARYGIAARQSSYEGGPVDLVFPFASYAQGLWGAAACVAALVERETSGRGQRVTVDARHGALVAATTTSLLDPEAPAPNTAVGPAGPTPNYAPYRCSDGEYVFLAALSPKFQRAAFAALGIPGLLDDPRIAHDGSKFFHPDNQQWVRETIAAAFVTRPRTEWLEVLKRADVPCGPLGTPETWLDHPQLRALGQRVELDDPRVGVAVTPGVPLTFTHSPLPVPRPREFTTDGVWRRPALPLPSPSPVSEDPSDGPLAGVRVLDLGTVVAGPFAGRLLAGLGADVVKVEPLTGDTFRPMGAQYTRGHRSLAIDLTTPAGRETYLRVVEHTDVALDNFRPGVLEKLGIDHSSLQLRNSRVVSASITGFGGIGPIGGDPGFDPVLQAMSGMMSAQGGDSEPVFHTVAANDLSAGVATVLGICAALFARSRQGIGQNVSTSLAAVAAYMINGETVSFEGRPPVRKGGRDHRGPSPLSRFYRTTDGWVRIHVDGPAPLVDAGLLYDADVAELEAALTATLAGETSANVVSRLRGAGGIAVVARTSADIANDPAEIEGGYFQAVEREDGKVFHFANHYARFGRTERRTPLPFSGVGEDTRAVLAAAGLTSADVDALCADRIVAADGRLAPFAIAAYR